jgi:capsular exopolysaccharide synthesis family protein
MRGSVYTLLVTKGPDAGLRFPIREGRVSVGRAPDMSIVLTDPTVRARHFVVIFEEGSWKAITYEPDATILIDRRWEHPTTRQRGARIFVGDSQLLLFAGDIDLRTARAAGEGLDIDEETLRDEALTTVGDEGYQFRHDMKGRGQRTRDRLAPPPERRAAPPPEATTIPRGAPGPIRGAPRSSEIPTGRGAPAKAPSVVVAPLDPRGTPPGSSAMEARGASTPPPHLGGRTPPPNLGRTPPPNVGAQSERLSARSPLPGSRTPPPSNIEAPPGGRLPEGVLSTGAENAGMARPPLDELRQSAPPVDARRSSWDRAIAVPPAGGRAPQKGLQIRLSDTAIASMPSQSRDLWVLYEKDGPFAAELRILATRLDELRNTFGYRSFLFTSVNEGEGKTVTASNLALVMSEDPERRIALVDANFRNPRAAELFNLDRERGLLAAISGQRSLSECVARVVGRNLIVLHAGGEHKNPAEVLSDPKFKTLVNELSQAVDFMIIDAPSALGHADVPLLAQHCDAVFLVVGANQTKRADLDKAIETIGRNRVVGTIFRPVTG